MSRNRNTRCCEGCGEHLSGIVHRGGDDQLYCAAGCERKKLARDTEPDWEGECEVCGASPVVPITGMCGPCTFGEAETIGGNW